MNSNQQTDTVTKFISQHLNANDYNSDNDKVLLGPTNQYYAIANEFNGNYVTDGSLLEPAVLNFNHVNVRMYGQDNTVNLTAFNYYVINPD